MGWLRAADRVPPGLARGADPFHVPSANVEDAPVAAPPSPPPAGGGGEAGGEAIFASSCASCHTLAAAGSNGTIGPNLDEAKPARELAIDRVTNGKGAMPSFKGQLSEEQIQAVATFVAEQAGQ